ncbi:MAG TPA: c-type cytochrome, partial [Planctomycetota bacterium]|nr:c-type cytochrome [Planctomycetota bacterium]
AYNQDTPIDPGMAPMGQPLYERFCVQCHGATGDGHGALSEMLIPPPRDFTRGIFKGRSSHPDLPPTATDLMRSLIHGIPLSAMLSYSFINTFEQMSLIAYVRSLAAKTFEKGFGFPLKSGNFHRDAGMPFPTAETIARGRALFDRMACVKCHGVDGDAKGELAGTLTDSDDGRPSNVRDLTQGIYSGGPNVRHMYLRVSGGVQGTVMPGFATSASVDDRWALAHYVMSLSQRAKELPLPHSELLAVSKVAAPVPSTPGDPAWAALADRKRPAEAPGPFGYPMQPFYVLPIYFQQLRHNTARRYFTEAFVSALHDGTTLAIRVEWEDASEDPGDRIEIELQPEKRPGFAIYGSEADPVSLWRWEGKAPKAAAKFDAKGPFAVVPQAGVLNDSATGVYDAAKKRWAVVFTRSLAGGGGSDGPIAAGDNIPFLVHMKDGSEAWPEGTRKIEAPPDSDPADVEKAKADEAERQKREKAIQEKFKDLPRHMTTWHHLQLE